jgi:transposase
MWQKAHRKAADRRGLRYPSDLTDGEWAVIEPMIPPEKRGGRHRTTSVRALLDGIFYILSTGCQWGALPKDFPPKSTVNFYFKRWEEDGTLDDVHDLLYGAVRVQKGRSPSPSLGIIDSQTAKGSQKGGPRETRRALIQARKRKAASATSSSIH